MASSGIDIRIGADVNDAVSGVNDVNDALEKVADQLDDVGRGGTKDVEKLEKSISDLNREALQADDKLDRAFGRDFKRKTAEAKSGMDDLKQESMQTARETAASFDGSLDSVAGMFQEVSANALQGFGPAGAAAGLAAAAGIGIAVNALTAIEENAQKTRERIAAIAGEMIKVGGVGKVSLQYVSDGMIQVISDTKEGAKKMDQLREMSKKTKVPLSDLVEAYAGGTDNLDKLVAKAQEQLEVTKKTEHAAQGLASAQDIHAAAVGEAQNYVDSLVAIQEETKKATDIDQQYHDLGIEAMQSREAELGMLNQAYDDASGNILDFVDKETGVIDTAGYIQSMKDREKALLDYQSSLATASLTPEQKAALNSMGFEAASTWMTAYKNGSAAQKKDLEHILTTRASEASGAAKNVVDATFAKPTDAVVKTTVDQASVNAAKTAIQNGITTGTYKIKIAAFDKNGKPVD